MRDKLAMMKQKGSIEDYNDAFNRIMAQIEDMTDTEAIPQYLQGLSPRYWELILARENMPTTLEALQLACIRFDPDNKQRHDEAHATDLGGYRGGGRDNRGGYAGRSRGYNNEYGNNRGGHNDRSDRGGDRRANRGGNFRGHPQKCYVCEGEHGIFQCNKFNDWVKTEKEKAKPRAEANLVISAIIDSGTTQHMFNQLEIFETVAERDGLVTCAGNEKLHTTHIGTIELDDELKLQDVLYVPEIARNLISVRALTRDGNDITFKSDGSVIKIGADHEEIKIGQADGNLFHLSTSLKLELEANIADSKIDDYILWH